MSSESLRCVVSDSVISGWDFSTGGVKHLAFDLNGTTLAEMRLPAARISQARRCAAAPRVVPRVAHEAVGIFEVVAANVFEPVADPVVVREGDGETGAVLGRGVRAGGEAAEGALDVAAVTDFPLCGSSGIQGDVV